MLPCVRTYAASSAAVYYTECDQGLEHNVHMGFFRHAVLAVVATLTVSAEAPTLPGVGAAMQEMIAKSEIAGAVTLVVSKDRILHLESSGLADIAAKRPMTPDALFWIASMTKPVTGVAVLM